MGNDREISQTRPTEIFLRKDLLPSFDKPKLYSLEEEFKKTKKNRPIKVYFIVILFLSIITLITLLLTSYLQEKNKDIAIDISDFQDINLTELLNTAKKNQAKLEEMKQELDNLKQQMQFDIILAKDKATRETELLLAKNLSEAERKIELAKIKTNSQKEIQTIQFKYQGEIDEKQKQIEELQKQVDAYNKQLASVTRQVEDVLANYQKIHELQIAKQRKFYENRITILQNEYNKQMQSLKTYYKEYIDSLILKYNPIFNEPNLQAILKQKISDIPQYTLNPYQDILASENILTEKEFQELRQSINNQLSLIGRLTEIPYINSVQPALFFVSYYNKLLLKTYEDLWAKMLVSLENKRQILGQYQEAMVFYTRLNRENGFIVSANDSKNLIVMLHPSYRIKNGARAFVFRDDMERIGIIRLWTDRKEYIRGEVLEASKKIQPFDKILLIKEE